MKTYENIRKDGCNFCRFIRNKKSKNRIIRINTGILSNMKQKIKEFYH